MTVGIIGLNWDSGNWVKLYNEKRQDLEEQHAASSQCWSPEDQRDSGTGRGATG